MRSPWLQGYSSNVRTLRMLGLLYLWLNLLHFWSVVVYYISKT